MTPVSKDGSIIVENILRSCKNVELFTWNEGSMEERMIEMKCQYCHENDSNLSFIVSWMGMEQEVHICEECANKWKQYIESVHKHYAQSRMEEGGWMAPEGQGKVRDLGNSPFLRVISSDIKKKRQLNILKNQLKIAIEKEQYEEAAKIRDEIKKEEKEVAVYE